MKRNQMVEKVCLPDISVCNNLFAVRISFLFVYFVFSLVYRYAFAFISGTISAYTVHPPALHDSPKARGVLD